MVLNLHRRCMGAQQELGRNIERILHIPGRVIGGHIQRLKVIVVALDFRSPSHLEAKAGKNFLDFIENRVKGVLSGLRGKG
jgi:hypothetical protein